MIFKTSFMGTSRADLAVHTDPATVDFVAVRTLQIEAVEVLSSHLLRPPFPCLDIRYIGILSRFRTAPLVLV